MSICPEAGSAAHPLGRRYHFIGTLPGLLDQRRGLNARRTRPLGQQPLQGLRGKWSAEVEALAGMAPDGLQVGELAAQLNALGHGLDAERLAQGDDRVRQR